MECKNETKIEVLDEKISVANKRIYDLEEKTKGMPRIETLLEIAIETNKEQQGQFKEVSKTLGHINDNLTNLNVNQRQLSERVSEIETTLNQQKVDVVQIMKKILIWLVVVGLAGLATYFGLTK